MNNIDSVLVYQQAGKHCVVFEENSKRLDIGDRNGSLVYTVPIVEVSC